MIHVVARMCVQGCVCKECVKGVMEDGRMYVQGVINPSPRGVTNWMRSIEFFVRI